MLNAGYENVCIFASSLVNTSIHLKKLKNMKQQVILTPAKSLPEFQNALILERDEENGISFYVGNRVTVFKHLKCALYKVVRDVEEQQEYCLRVTIETFKG